eukprot:TRINITY_DN43_c1_g1_i7.p1 TRINITY_DN43_c1_g1~~TRINITY_DN43_c1_g1_i7.p1  ORF type:complete len:491 (+),score=125.85 TRINITY_DN43_c1_g1_i7:90-1475(+)
MLMLKMLLFAALCVGSQGLKKLGAGTGPGQALDAMVDMASFGDYVYGAELGGNLKIVDVADKANPVELGEIPRGARGNARAVLVSGDLLYVAWRHAMVVYTLQNPAVPAVLNTFAPQDANRRNDRGIAESAHHIYVAYMNKMTRLESFYVLTKGSLNLVGMYTPTLTTETDSLETMDMVHHDGKVYATRASVSHWRISTFLVSDPANPSLHAMKAIPDFGFGRIVHHEGSLYVSEVSNELWRVDAASLSQQPLTVPAAVTGKLCSDVQFRGSRMYLACRGAAGGGSSNSGNGGVFVLEEAAATGTFSLLAMDEVAMVLTLLVEGDYLFLSDLGKSLAVYDISSAKCPPPSAAPVVELVGGPAMVTVKVPSAAATVPDQCCDGDDAAACSCGGATRVFFCCEGRRERADVDGDTLVAGGVDGAHGSTRKEGDVLEGDLPCKPGERPLHLLRGAPQLPPVQQH